MPFFDYHSNLYKYYNEIIINKHEIYAFARKKKSEIPFFFLCVIVNINFGGGRKRFGEARRESIRNNPIKYQTQKRKTKKSALSVCFYTRSEKSYLTF